MENTNQIEELLKQNVGKKVAVTVMKDLHGKITDKVSGVIAHVANDPSLAVGVRDEQGNFHAYMGIKELNLN